MTSTQSSHLPTEDHDDIRSLLGKVAIVTGVNRRPKRALTQF
jgi:hypothetical protein